MTATNGNYTDFFLNTSFNSEFFRPDVVLDRMRFIGEYEMYYRDAVKIDPVTLDITDLDKPYILISEDEKIHHRCCL